MIVVHGLIKWLGKDELRAFEHANKSRGLRATAKVYYNNAYAFALEKCKVGVQNIIEGREFNDSGKK